MPFSVKQIRCRVDPDLDEALFDFQERLGDQYLGAQSVLAELETIRASVEADLLTPAQGSLNRVLAVADTSTSEMEDAMDLVVAGTTEDVESSIGDRYGINVVNGRIVPDGDLDISAIQELTRLTGGSVADVLEYIPEIEDLPIDSGADREFREMVSFAPRFILVATYLKTTVTPATKCSPEIVVEEEITAGVEVPLSTAAASLDVAVDDLRIYIFWLGTPDAGPRIRAKARSLGLTNAQFVDAVSLSSSENFRVRKIDDPMDILRLIAAFGGDVDDILSRVSGPISLFEDPTQLIDDIRDTFGRSTGASSPSGFRDFSSPASSLLSVIDIDKTFNLTETLEGLSSADDGSSLPATQFVAGITGAIQSQLLAITAILTQAQGILAGVLTEVSNLQTIVFNVFSDLSNGTFDCLFGAGFSTSLGFPEAGSPGSISGVGGIGGPGTPGTPGLPSDNPLEDLISSIEGQSQLIRDFTGSLNELFGSISSISCMGSFVAGAITSQNSFPNSFISCASELAQDAGLEMPENVLDSIGVVKQVMDFVSSLFDFATSNLRTLRLTAVGLSSTLRQTLSTRSATTALGTGSGGCAPPEAARLASLLQSRAEAAFTVSVEV